jgi:O-succinylbenzoic acid--CoA ligase
MGTAGKPIPGAEVAIGDDGRIRVRGAMVSPGYVGEAARRDEWFDTTDRGRFDEAGRLIVLGRMDSVIVTGGENVDPGVVEEVLRGIAGVLGVRVFGEADAEWGSRVVAEVVLDPGVTLAAIVSESRRLLAPHEVPRDWRPVAEVQPAKLI